MFIPHWRQRLFGDGGGAGLLSIDGENGKGIRQTQQFTLGETIGAIYFSSEKGRLNSSRIWQRCRRLTFDSDRPLRIVQSEGDGLKRVK